MTTNTIKVIKSINGLTQAELSQKLRLSRYSIINAERSNKLGRTVRRRVEEFLGHPLDSPQVKAAFCVLQGSKDWPMYFRDALDNYVEQGR